MRTLGRRDDIELDEEIEIARLGIKAVVYRRAEELKFARDSAYTGPRFLRVSYRSAFSSITDSI